MSEGTYAPFIVETPVRRLDPGEFCVVLLGTGTPRAYPGAAKPAVAVLVAGRVLLFDCGGEVVRQLIHARIMPQRVLDVFFTHHHSDHNSGFFDLYISGWRSHVGVIDERRQPLRVYGPTNTRRVIGELSRGFDYDAGFRIGYNGANPLASRIEYHESDQGVLYDQDGVVVRSFEVDHRPVAPAVGYRIEWAGRSVVISGDTRPVPNLCRHAEAADLLIQDAFNRSWLEAVAVANPGLEEQVLRPARYHTSTLEAAQLAADARVRHLVLTHHIPQPKPTAEAESAYTQGMAELYAGPITVGRDFMEFVV